MRVATYNIEWFDGLFDAANGLRPDATALGDGTTVGERVAALERVFAAIDADLVGIVEAPNTLASGDKSTTACLEAFAARVGIRTSKAAMGFVSPGSQELAVLYDPDRLAVTHVPGDGGAGAPPFDREFVVESDGIRELHRHYRPPLELEVERRRDGRVFRVLLVHLKSKGIFDRVDWVHWQRISERNRRKLFAETQSVRWRVDDWLAGGHDVIVMGDVNDGPGMDQVETAFQRSAVETLMGDIFEPDRLLVSHAGRPRWTDFGWDPASASFTDQFTHDRVNVLIDHILVSRTVAVAPGGAHTVWNPWQAAADAPDALRDALRAASDHFPVTLDIA